MIETVGDICDGRPMTETTRTTTAFADPTHLDLSRSLVEAWGEEDGDRWYAEGHVDPLAMAFSVLLVEMHCVGPKDAAEILGPQDRGPDSVHDWLAAGQHLIDGVCHMWAKEAEDIDGYLPCDETDEGAEPWTELRL